jgi:lipoprotein-anchoring transpeptidase ErfK/SrfK
MLARSGLVAAVLAGSLLGGAPSQAVQSYPTRDAKRIEAVLAGLGLPVGPVDGVWDEGTARATCAWRELTGRPVLRSWPTVPERRALKATKSLAVPAGLWVGVNIDVRCQAAYWIVKGVVESTRVETHTVTLETLTATGESTTITTIETSTVVTRKPGQTLKRVFQVSTGMPDSYPTVPGKHTVAWTVNRWWQSTIYPDGKMYRPMFFNHGQALHGSSNDGLVKWYPASHGCVRMLHADIDALWAAGFGRGAIVNVYGTWVDRP